MEIHHWWLVKMVAIQLLCLLGIAWGVRYLRQSRLVTAKVKKKSVHVPSTAGAGVINFSQK